MIIVPVKEGENIEKSPQEIQAQIRAHRNRKGTPQPPGFRKTFGH